MTAARPVFFISDHTGITAEIIGKSLLTQFPGEAFAYVSLPFVDSLEKAHRAVDAIRQARLGKGLRPLVFSSMTDEAARAALDASGALVMDVYAQFMGMLSGELGRPATVQLILIGVSRSGKTPTSLFLAMQYGLRVANYPLTPEDFERPGLPAALRPHRDKLRGLTLSAERLAQIRGERKPDSRYANLQTCREELAAAERLMRDEGIPVIETTHRSIEEIAALLKQSVPQT